MPVFYGTQVDSALMLGTAQYPSPAILAEAFRASAAGIATVSLRREGGQGQAFWTLIFLIIGRAWMSAQMQRLQMQGG